MSNPPSSRSVYMNAAFDWSDDSTRLILTPSFRAKSMFYYVQEIGHFRTGPRYFTERANLESFLIIHTLAGRGYLHYRGKKHTMAPGQLMFIDCADYHRYETDRERLWELRWFHFAGGASREYCEQFARAIGPVATLRGDSAIPAAMERLLALHMNKDVRTEIAASSVIVSILTELLLLPYEEGEAAGAPFMPDYIARAAEFMQTRYDEPISHDRLARLFAASKSHLAHEFKRYTGFAPIEYLINVRITKAKELLRHTDKSVADIAVSVGFGSATHLINLFKKHENATPLEYRKRWRQ